MTSKVNMRDNVSIRRQRILDEATVIVGQRGYHGFTIQQLAQRCGLTNGGLLYHFGSKEQLLIAILEARDRRDAEIVPEGIDLSAQDENGGYTRPVILQLLRAIMVRSVAQPEITRLHIVLQSEALDAAHPAHEHFVRREAMVVDEFAAMIHGHCINPHATARQILALMDGLAQQWLRGGQRLDLVALWDEAITHILPDVTGRGPSDTPPTR